MGRNIKRYTCIHVLGARPKVHVHVLGQNRYCYTCALDLTEYVKCSGCPANRNLILVLDHFSNSTREVHKEEIEADKYTYPKATLQEGRSHIYMYAYHL